MAVLRVDSEYQGREGQRVQDIQTWRHDSQDQMRGTHQRATTNKATLSRAVKLGVAVLFSRCRLDHISKMKMKQVKMKMNMKMKMKIDSALLSEIMITNIIETPNRQCKEIP